MSEHSQAMEHRWGTRFIVDLTVELQTAHGMTGQATLRDVSLSGAFVRTLLQPPLLSRVSMQPLASGRWMQACVVRRDQNGIGVEWLEGGANAVSLLLATRRAAVATTPGSAAPVANTETPAATVLA